MLFETSPPADLADKAGMKTLRPTCRRLLLAALFAGAWPAWAQFSLVPTPMMQADGRASQADDERQYRRDAGRMLYDAFPMQVYRGKLPPLVHAIAITETDLDDEGRVRAVRLVREPAAAKEVGPWVVGLIRRLDRLPVPQRVMGHTWTEIWLVDKSGRFQVDALSEGQHHEH